MKHTPAPWGLVYNEDGTLELGMSGTNEITGIQSEAGFGTIALVINRKTNIFGDSKKLQYETFEANAKIISAAPDLLEALAICKTHLYDYSLSGITDKETRNDIRMALDKAKSALKKATE